MRNHKLQELYRSIHIEVGRARDRLHPGGHDHEHKLVRGRDGEDLTDADEEVGEDLPQDRRGLAGLAVDVVDAVVRHYGASDGPGPEPAPYGEFVRGGDLDPTPVQFRVQDIPDEVPESQDRDGVGVVHHGSVDDTEVAHHGPLHDESHRHLRVPNVERHDKAGEQGDGADPDPPLRKASAAPAWLYDELAIALQTQCPARSSPASVAAAAAAAAAAGGRPPL